ncbi:patatin-like phospholipase family protein [Aliidiomarina sp.]|uniref:patatin-like phospholipase family protein n=1 Tax=Aliidiomarina sp. TaxID=1872439 RepID=UPI003A4E4A71
MQLARLNIHYYRLPIMLMVLAILSAPLSAHAAEAAPQDLRTLLTLDNEALDNEAQEPIVPMLPARERPVVGLVLGGGGAKGLAHIGVLQVLEDLQIPIDLVVGTSMGAVAGGLYVQGHSPEDLLTLVETLDWQAAFQDEPSREFRSLRRKEEERRFPLQFSFGFNNGRLSFPPALIQGQQLATILRELSLDSALVERFDELPIPFRSVAVDIETGESVALEEGDLVLAMRASMAIPGLIAPVDWHGQTLVDGGVSANLPVQFAREMGADVVIVVDVNGELLSQKNLSGPFAMMDQSLNIMIRRNDEIAIASLTEADVYIRPDISSVPIGTGDFQYGREAYDLGFAAAEAQSAQLARYRVDDALWTGYIGSLRYATTMPEKIEFIHLDNLSSLPNALLQTQIESRIGDDFLSTTIGDDVDRLYGLGYFEQVDYSFMRDEENRAGIKITTVPRSWGPSYLRFGLSLEEDFDAVSNYRAIMSLLRTEVNSLGAELQIDAELGEEPLINIEYWQPLRRDARFYVLPRLKVSRENTNIYQEGEQVGRYRLTRYTSALDFGTTWRYNVDVRVGYEFGVGRAEARIQAPGLPREANFKTAKVVTTVTMDDLEDVFVPRSGKLVTLRYEFSDTVFGADDDFQSLHLHYLNAHSWGRNTLIHSVRLGSYIDSEAPLYNTFTLGGFMNLSGYDRRELSGSQKALGQLVFLREFGATRAISNTPLYIGGAIEAGQVWTDSETASWDDLVYSASAVMMVRTPIGAAYLGLSYSDNNRNSVYLSLGRNF